MNGRRWTRDLWRLAGVGAIGALAFAAGQPARAQIDIAGEWASRIHEDLNHRGMGAEIGDYAGLPLNEAGRLKADSWDAAILSAPEEQAKPHPVQYNMRGPSTDLRIVKIFDPYNEALIGYRITGTFGRADRTVWLDGRPHPSEHAEHKWQGFSTGVVKDDQLIVTTTHMKAGWIDRNGAPSSANAKLTEYFVRHGDLLTLTSILEDPVYLEEPMIRTMTWVYTPNLGVDNRMRFEPVEEVADRPRDFVPAYPLGTRHEEFAQRFGLPFAVTQGGAATLYPEYHATIQALLKGQAPPPTAPRPPAPTPAKAASELGAPVEDMEIRPGLHMLVVDGVNVTVQTGPDGVLIVDAGPAGATDKMLQAVRKLSRGPIRFLINTSYLPESTGGNEAVVKAGGPRQAPSPGSTVARPAESGVATIAHENVPLHLYQLQASPSENLLPTSTFHSGHKDLYFNDEPIELRAEAGARTDGDLVAFFRRSDVVSVGGLLDMTRFPQFDPTKGGSLDGVINALADVLEITIPVRNQMDGTLVIPSRGRIGNEADVDEYRNMAIIVRDRIKSLIAKKMTLEQVKAARPLLDYEGVYGSNEGPWTTNMFLEAVYNEYKPAAGAKK